MNLSPFGLCVCTHVLCSINDIAPTANKPFVLSLPTGFLHTRHSSSSVRRESSHPSSRDSQVNIPPSSIFSMATFRTLSWNATHTRLPSNRTAASSFSPPALARTVTSPSMSPVCPGVFLYAVRYLIIHKQGLLSHPARVSRPSPMTLSLPMHASLTTMSLGFPDDANRRCRHRSRFARSRCHRHWFTQESFTEQSHQRVTSSRPQFRGDLRRRQAHVWVGQRESDEAGRGGARAHGVAAGHQWRISRVLEGGGG